MDVEHEAGIGPVYVQNDKVKIEILSKPSSVPFWKDIFGFVADIGYQDDFEVLRIDLSGQTPLNIYETSPDFKNFRDEVLNKRNLGLHPYDVCPRIYKEFNGDNFNMIDFFSVVDSVIKLEKLFADKYEKERDFTPRDYANLDGIKNWQVKTYLKFSLFDYGN